MANLNEIEVKCYQETIELISKGLSYRVIGNTEMNSRSSRSHLIITFTLKKRKFQSQFLFVDLAGSERRDKTKSSGNRALESNFINKSLSALSNVLKNISENKKNPSHVAFVPYRGDNLTKLLKISIGGNSNTLMVACINPIKCYDNETISTLRFANNAKAVQNITKINIVSDLFDKSICLKVIINYILKKTIF